VYILQVESLGRYTEKNGDSICVPCTTKPWKQKELLFGAQSKQSAIQVMIDQIQTRNTAYQLS
jgi:hypothetical protein